MDDETDVEPEELDEELDDDIEEDIEEDLDEDIDVAATGLDDDLEADPVKADKDDEEEEEEEDVPRARRVADDDDDDEELDPDDVEADLDAILKDRIAAGTDEEDDEPADERTDVEGPERVAAKTAEEFTCTGCFMIVHPRQFGRAGHLTCPEGYDPCPSIDVVEKRLARAAKK